MKAVYWLPRILGLGFAIFIALFALDIFSEASGWAAVLPFLIHLIPALVLAIIVLVAWRYPLFGAFSFLVIALYYVYMVGWGRHWSWYISISGPALIVAILFYWDACWRRND